MLNERLAFGGMLNTDSDPLLPKHRIAVVFDVARMILRERGHALVLPVGELLVTVCTPIEVPQNPEGEPGSWGVELSDWSTSDERRAIIARTISVSDQSDPYSSVKSFFNFPKYVDLNPRGSMHLPYLNETMPEESEEEFAGVGFTGAVASAELNSGGRR